VLLLGATNFFDRLDAALVRPGRLQQRIAVRAPESSEEIAALLRLHLRDELADADLNGLAQFGLGATPAMVEGWVRSARALARSGKRALGLEELMVQILPKDDRSPADITAIAVHEAGHALVAYRLGHLVNLVSIVPQGLAAGHVSSQLPTLVPTLADVRDVVTIMLAGRAADLVLGKGATAGASGDLEQATTMLLAARDKQGLGTSLIYAPALGSRPDAAAIAEVTDDLELLLARAVAMIETESALPRKLARHLARHKMLTGSELAALLGPGLPVTEASEPLDDTGTAIAKTAMAA
jgi:cell division protease FtsH